MELLIAVLIAFGAITAEDKGDITMEKAESLIKEYNITQSDIDKQEKIINMEENDI